MLYELTFRCNRCGFSKDIVVGDIVLDITQGAMLYAELELLISEHNEHREEIELLVVREDGKRAKFNLNTDLPPRGTSRNFHIGRKP